jgi:hypothetical protein
MILRAVRRFGVVVLFACIQSGGLYKNAKGEFAFTRIAIPCCPGTTQAMCAQSMGVGPLRRQPCSMALRRSASSLTELSHMVGLDLSKLQLTLDLI